MASLDAGDETKQEHLQAMGPILGPFYHELFNEVVWLHAKWAEYRKLYGKSKERIYLLNKTASFYFYVIECTLREDVLLHISRLTDPPATLGRYENLTIQSLPNLVSDNNLVEELRSLTKECLKRSRFARKLRDKQLAHIDLSHAINPKAKPLPSVSRKRVEAALASIRYIMNCVYGAYFQEVEFGFDHFIVHDDADLLVHHLLVADRYEKRQRARFRQNKLLPEDLEEFPKI